MNKIVSVLGAVAVLFALAAPRSARAEEKDDDFAIRLLHRVERLRGGAGNSPLEEKIRSKLERMSAMEAGSAGGGFEPPPEAGTQPAPSDDDSQFAALTDIMQKMSSLDRVKSGIWFLVIRPSTRHREEVQRMIDQNSTAMNPQQQADFREYMDVRRGLAGASYGTRVDRWLQFSKSKPQSTFAELANREAQYVKSIQKDNSAAKSSHRGGVLVKVGIVVLVLLLIGAIIFGAAK